MKTVCGLLMVALAVALVSAGPLQQQQQQPLDLGERVKLALRQKGITLEKLPQIKDDFPMRDAVGDIWSNCGSSGDIGTISNVVITPDPPQKGSDLTVEADVTLSEKVSAGTIQLKVQYYVLGFPVTVIDETIDICGEETGLTCPLDEGTHHIKFSNEVPSSAPGGKYTGNAVATSSDDGKQILCINLDFNL